MAHGHAEKLYLQSTFQNEKASKADYGENELLGPGCRNKPRGEVKVTSSSESECPRAQKWMLHMFTLAG